MSIPDRFYRIAKHKLGEVKDWFDKVDEEEEEDARQKRRANPRENAQRELSDSLPSAGSSSNGAAVTSPRGSAPSAVPLNPPRTPQDYARGGQASGYATGGSGGSGGNGGSGSGFAASSQPDPLDYHYKLLGLEAGADFPAVHAAYNKLAARSDPSRFPAGSSDAQAAQQIRQRLDVSFKTLREALDTTAARFGLLEFDDTPKKREEDTREEGRENPEDNRRKLE